MRFSPGFLKSVRDPPVLTYITKAAITANATSYNFGSLSIGAAAIDRLVIAALFAHNGSGDPGFAPTSLTLDAVDMDSHGSTLGTGANETSTSIFSMLVPTGTTAAFVANFVGDAQTRAGIAIFTLEDYLSAIPLASPSNTADGVTNLGAAFTIEPGEMIGLAAGNCRNTDVTTVSWAGATESDEIILESGVGVASVAIVTATGTVTPTFSSLGSLGLRGAVWG